MTVRRYEEIRLAEGRGLREIARASSCSRDTVPEVREHSDNHVASDECGVVPHAAVLLNGCADGPALARSEIPGDRDRARMQCRWGRSTRG